MASFNLLVFLLPMQHVGTLHLNKDCSFHYGDGSPKDGYKFELQIAKKKKKFKVRNAVVSELVLSTALSGYRSHYSRTVWS